MLLKQAAPITLTCFAKNLALYAEQIPFARRGREQSAEQAAGSNVYLLCQQYEDLYSSSWACIFRRKNDLILYFEKSTLVVRIIGQLVCYSIFRGYLTNYPL